jgi:hypothetical protein
MLSRAVQEGEVAARPVRTPGGIAREVPEGTHVARPQMPRPGQDLSKVNVASQLAINGAGETFCAGGELGQLPGSLSREIPLEAIGRQQRHGKQ